EFMGSLDEAEAALGLASSIIPNELQSLREKLNWIQALLFRIGFTVSGKKCISQDDLKKLEEIADSYSSYVGNQFVLNGGHPAAAAVSLARTLVRRAERRLVELIERKEPIGEEQLVLSLMNRISSSLYAIQLAINGITGEKADIVKCES
ncbi:MAG: ATP:cob(I)alamin adenosyltransferase, partial [Fervidicoccaceae archaeon]